MANEWTLWTDSNGNGISLEPTDCQPIHMFELSEGMNSPFFANNTDLLNHAVEMDMFEEPFCTSCWNITSNMLVNNGLQPANFEENYNYNTWYIGNNGVLNTGPQPANFENPYNWCAWYLDEDPETDFDINTGPWEEMLGAFANEKNITSLIIPDQVTKIGDNAFRRSGITEVSLPNNIEYFDNDIERSFPKDCTINVRNE